MTAELQGAQDAPQPEAAPRTQALPRRKPVSISGIVLIAELELRQRVRSTKWKWALATVAALIAMVTGLVYLAVHTDEYSSGDVVFGLIVFFVLFLGLIVSPTLSATSINGDAKEATLAPLQATSLPAADIVIGKLVASWIASLAFVAVSVPFLLFAFLDSESPIGAMFTVVGVLSFELLVVCAIGLGWSALTARTPASAVLTFVTVAVLTAIMPIIFGLLLIATPTQMTVTTYSANYYSKENAPEDAVWDGYDSYYVCESYTSVESVERPDRLWWLLAVNPYVIVADSAPSKEREEGDGYYYASGPLDSIKQGVRELRLGPEPERNWCDETLLASQEDRIEERDQLGAVWPFGLAAQGLLAAGSVWLAIRRVRVPYGKLQTGTRVA